MARIRPDMKTPTDKFNELKDEAWRLGEVNDCTVKALAIAANIPYAEAHALLAAKGRKPRQGAHMFQYHGILRELGFTVARVDKMEFNRKYRNYPRYTYKNLTSHHVANFPEAWNDGQTYLLQMSGHVGAVVDGKLHDWTVGRSKHIKGIYRIEKKTT